MRSTARPSRRWLGTAAVLIAAAALTAIVRAATQTPAASLNDVQTIVVIYAENRSFDVLYGMFPGANGLSHASPTSATQLDRDGKPLKELPPIWGGLTVRGANPPVTQAETAHLPNGPFAIDDAKGFHQDLSVTTRDLVHKFYQNQMQIDGGKNDKFVAWGDSGALVMGHYNGAEMKMWNVAKEYVLADNFFMGAFGSSFLNHQWLICACIPVYPHADTSPAKGLVSKVAPNGVSLVQAPDQEASAVNGAPRFVLDGTLTPDFHAVNTMQPPFQPSGNPPAAGGDARLADPSRPTTLPPQTAKTIGDLLSAKHVSWAWFSGAWQATLDGPRSSPVPNFQYHHQPFNFFDAYAPGTPARDEHLKDGGLAGAEFIKAIDAGALPQVTFYKPQGDLNEHAGYADIKSGDAHLATLIEHLKKSPQWDHMVVIVTYDENGGFWDHAAPPKGDRWGPGTRIPAIVVSPYAKMGTIDHTVNDTTSILRLITKRFGLPTLPGIAARDAALKAHGVTPGNLTEALNLRR